jgi:hypothetical protein
MRSERSGGSEGSKQPEKDDDEAPETPLDEPRPPRIEDPPPQPDPKHPYVVKHMNRALAARARTALSSLDAARASGGGAPRA